MDRSIGIFGAPGVGKIATLIQFQIDERFEMHEDYEIDGQVETLHLCVFHNEYHDDISLRDLFTQLRVWMTPLLQGFILMYSISNRASFHQVQRIYEEILRLKDKKKDFHMILVGNKCDLDSNRQVEWKEGADLAFSWKIPFLEASAKSRINIDEQFFELVREFRCSDFLTNTIKSLESKRANLQNLLEKPELDKKLRRMHTIMESRELRKHIIHIHKKMAALPFSEPPNLIVSANTIVEDLATLYNNQSYSDVTVYVNDVPFYCHMSLLKCRCPALYSRFKSEMDRNDTTDVILPTATSASFPLLLKFIYTGNLNGISKDEVLMTNLLNFASTYNMRRLQQCVEQRNAEPIENYIKDLKTLLTSAVNSDAIFVVDGKIFLVHKFILGTRCGYFSGLFSHSWKDNQTGQFIYNITSMNAKMFGLLLEFLYTGEVEEISMETVTELLTVANQYTLPRLKELCEKFLFDNLDGDSVIDCYFGAQLNMCPQLEKYCIYMMQQPHFFPSIPSTELKKLDPKTRKDIELKYLQNSCTNSVRESLKLEKELFMNSELPISK